MKRTLLGWVRILEKLSDSLNFEASKLPCCSGVIFVVSALFVTCSFCSSLKEGSDLFVSGLVGAFWITAGPVVIMSSIFSINHWISLLRSYGLIAGKSRSFSSTIGSADILSSIVSMSISSISPDLCPIDGSRYGSAPNVTSLAAVSMEAKDPTEL